MKDLTVALAATLLTIVISTVCATKTGANEDRPNILWLTAEDIGTELGCYGDEYAKTPRIDQLSARGLRYLTAWSNAPVCALARSTLISGMYPPSLGSHHMRSLIRMPDEARMYPCYLRDAGYYCTNNSKQDYNLELTGEVMFNSRTAQEWKQRFDEGKLPPHQAAFWKTKPSEELYDLAEDPDEVRNLVDSPEHQELLARMRLALRQWQLEIRDVGLLPEGELHRRSEGSTPYSMGHDADQYRVETILATSELATNGQADGLDELKDALASSDIAVRYWGAIGMLCRGKPAVELAKTELRAALRDDSPCVRLAAAEALARYGKTSDREPALDVLCSIASQETNGYAVLEAVNALEYVCVDLVQQGIDPQSLANRMKKIDPNRDYLPESRLNNKLIAWPQRVLSHIETILTPSHAP